MRPLTLCLERLLRIQVILKRADGKMAVRELMRSFAIQPWEIEQAATVGWVKVYIRAGKGGKGRPSRVVEVIPEDKIASLPLPPARNQISREISVRHQVFAMRAVWECVPRGIKALGFPGVVAAYIKTYNPRSYAGARASASRLMRHPHVRAAMQWFRAQVVNEIPRGEAMPQTSIAIWRRLHDLENCHTKLIDIGANDPGCTPDCGPS
jgi:hypothetical protein